MDFDINIVFWNICLEMHLHIGNSLFLLSFIIYEFLEMMCMIVYFVDRSYSILGVMLLRNELGQICISHSCTELQVGDVSEIIEEPQTSQNQKKQILSVEIPSTSEGSTEDFIRITMPPTPNRTPKRVNFSPRPSPSFYGFNDSPSPLSSRRKSSMKNLLPKLSFKFRNSNSEIEKAAILALGGSPIGSQEKPIQRTMSLTKLFAPKMKRTSSLPVTPIEHSNPESTHGGNTINCYAVSILYFALNLW